MTQFAMFALYLCMGCFLLVMVPVMLHPTLPQRRKILICVLSFVLLVPISLGLYALIGAPPMAAKI